MDWEFFHGLPLCLIVKRPTAQMAHLVFADTKANAEKPKEPFFCKRTDRKKLS